MMERDLDAGGNDGQETVHRCCSFHNSLCQIYVDDPMEMISEMVGGKTGALENRI